LSTDATVIVTPRVSPPMVTAQVTAAPALSAIKDPATSARVFFI
jgi:hypothetical protein